MIAEVYHVKQIKAYETGSVWVRGASPLCSIFKKSVIIRVIEFEVIKKHSGWGLFCFVLLQKIYCL